MKGFCALTSDVSIAALHIYFLNKSSIILHGVLDVSIIASSWLLLKFFVPTQC